MLCEDQKEVLWTLQSWTVRRLRGKDAGEGSLWSGFSVCSVLEAQGVGSLSVLWKHFSILKTDA